MFIPPFMLAFLINKIDEEGDNGGGTEVDNQPDEFGVPYEAPSVEDTDTGNVDSVEGDSTPKISPAWEKVLNTLPKEFHSQVTPEFDAWDKNFAKVQSDYAPYKPLLENNVSMEDIQSSIQLAKWVSADPQAVYNELGRRFGFGKEQGQPQVEDDSDEEDDDVLDLSQQEQNPQLAKLEQTVQSLQQMLQQEAIQKQDNQIRDNAAREIQNEWSQLESQIRQPLSPDVRKEIIRRAVAIGDETGGEYSLTAGYQDYAAFVNRVRNSRANNTAPAVLPGNGGLPVTKKNFGQMDEDERINYIAGMAKNLNEG